MEKILKQLEQLIKNDLESFENASKQLENYRKGYDNLSAIEQLTCDLNANKRHRELNYHYGRLEALREIYELIRVEE